jgi:hypothetical protein
MTGYDGFFPKLFLWRYVGTFWEKTSEPVISLNPSYFKPEKKNTSRWEPRG